MKVICDNCGKEFNKKEANIKITKHNYCSRNCVIEDRKRKPKKCLCCGREFIGHYDAKFCSRSCSASYNNKGKSHVNYKYPEKKEIVIDNGNCIRCGKQITNKWATKFCSSQCYNSYQKEIKINDFLNGKLNDSTVRRSVIREFLISRQGGVCEICKNKPFHNEKPLVFIIDHIDGNFKNNNPDNIRAICPNCNSQTDTFTGKNIHKFSDKRHKKNYR